MPRRVQLPRGMLPPCPPARPAHAAAVRSFVLLQPEAVRAAIDAVLAQPLDALGEALQGFTWEFESKASGAGTPQAAGRQRRRP